MRPRVWNEEAGAPHLFVAAAEEQAKAQSFDSAAPGHND